MFLKPMDTAASELLRHTLLSDLECPVCRQYMLPPISLCVNGHNICKSCKPNMKHCPTCRHPFTTIRCLSLEKLAAELDFPCTYQTLGCKETRRAKLITQHQALCPYGTFSCPLQCRVRLSREALVKHVKEKHEQDIHEWNERVQYVKIQNYDVTKNYTQVILAHNEVFVRSIKVINDIWYFLTQYIGTEKDPGRFYYTVSFDSKDHEDTFIKITHGCRSANEDENEIYSTCKCIMLPVEVIKYTVVDGELSYYFQIKRKA
ncbi:putative E3 ubiquitin-protein ligase SINAT1 [Zootermopsis nevadensis]|uniref:RING-type E3 ubiquitin transferase n=1 Tax=Zootermopsis nevadensis TaxID=136037 RepID=A0A067QGE4_ZOONE|nr:putative E3 ubiquitin-protein ligase SINAT1 [Zootermopsis nevadensis]KDR07297.1 Putative E3 ubiquitin-protein ligase SINAT1 [Zootermopsis nevadensis]